MAASERGKPKEDIVLSSILQNKFRAIVAEMEKTLINTAYSHTISFGKQCGAAILSESGQLIAVSNPVYMYPLAMTAQRVIDAFEYDLSADDVFLTNDPYGGGTRIPDFTLVAPVAHGDTISFFVAVCGQTEDFAGDVRGNFNPTATEIWAEGARCTPIRLVLDGKLRKDVLQTLCLNSRNPEAFRLDVAAMRAAGEVGNRRLQGLFNTHGSDSLLAGVEWTLDYSERRMTSLLEKIPDGEYSGTSTLVHDAHGKNGLAIQVRIATGGPKLLIDFSGSDAQSTGFMNATKAVASTFAVLPLVAAFGGDVPCDAGAMRCIELNLPEGTLVNASYPAPTGWGLHHPGNEIAEAVVDALMKALPDQAGRITANSHLLYSIHKAERHGRTLEQLEMYDFSALAQGDDDATHERDGWGMPGIAARVPLPSVELYETDRGGLIEQLEYMEDSGGAGAFRGGMGTLSVVSLPQPSSGAFYLTGVVTPRVGGDARPVISVEADGEIFNVGTHLCGMAMGANARVTLRMSGGKGWGNPMDRPVEQVYADFANGFITSASARRDYGVAIDEARLSVDEAETERLRSDQTRRRG